MHSYSKASPKKTSHHSGRSFFASGETVERSPFFSPTPASDKSTIQAKCKNCASGGSVINRSLNDQNVEKKEERGGIQAKLLIGQAGDRHEQEADRVAEQVVQRMQPGKVTQPSVPAMQTKTAKEEDEGLLQTKPTNGTPQQSHSIESRLSNLRGAGETLPREARASMEHAFGSDFSSVRIHTNPTSQQLNRDLNARAFTHKSDIFFNSGEYQPQTTEGQRLLAHELTHVLQQSAAVSPALQKQRPGSLVNRTSGSVAYSRTHHPLIQREPRRHSRAYWQRRVTECMQQTDDILPGHVGLLVHMLRESELNDVLGDERAMLEEQIRLDTAARRFVCEAGVPAIIALYDTRRAGVHLEVDCARTALRQHSQHYTHSVLNRRRHLLLPTTFTPFTSRTNLYSSSSGRTRLARLDPGRQLRFLAATPTNRRRLVRVISGPNHCVEGYISIGSIVRSTATSMRAPRRVRLVFFENPERVGRTMHEVGAAITNRRTRLRVPQASGSDRTIRLERGRKFYFLSGHTGSEYHINIRIGSNRVEGYVPQAHVSSDHEHRRGERRFFVSVGRRIARARGAIFVDPASQTCASEAYPVEFFTARDIVRGLVAAAACTDALVDEVHIVGHGGTHGMPGTGDFSTYYGLYLNRYAQTLRSQPPGGMTVDQFAQETRTLLANGVSFWLHACSTADAYREADPNQARIPGFAEQLGSAMRSEGHHTEAIVAGLPGIGPADKGIRHVYRFILYPGGRKQFFPVRIR